MQNLANFTSDAIRGVGVLVSKLTDLDAKSGGVGQFLKDLTYYNPVRILARLGEETRSRPRANRNFGGSSIQGNLYDADAAKQKKLEADRLKVVKAQEALLKKQTAELKKQALTKKQSALFDLDQIQLVAALQGKLSKDERLRAELQLALLTGNTTEADKLSQKLAMSINSTGQLAAYLRALPDAKNPFLGWDEWLKNFTKNLANVTGSSIPTTTGGVSPAPVTTPLTNAVPSGVFNSLGSVDASTKTADEARRLYGGMGSSQPIVIQIDGKEIASVVQNQGLQGNNPIINRLGGGW
jgi:hypothetical protein